MRRAATATQVEPATQTVAASSFKLDQLDPRARLSVMTNVAHGEAEFTTGDALRQYWESSKVQRVSHFFNAAPAGWHDVQCPDGSRLFIRFTSPRYQLLGEPDAVAEKKENMSDKKHAAPPKKGAKKPTPPKPTAAPTAPKPVKAPVKADAVKTSTPVKKPSKTGNYAWLLKRLQAQIVTQLTTANNRGAVRDGLFKAETFAATRAFCESAKVADHSTFEKFLNEEFFTATINR